MLNVGRKTTPRVNVYTLSLLPVFIFLLLLLHHLQRFVPNNPAFLVPTHHPAAPLLRHCSESLLYDGCNHGSILAHHDTRRIVNPVKDNHSVILSRNPSTVQQRGRRQQVLGSEGMKTGLGAQRAVPFVAAEQEETVSDHSSRFGVLSPRKQHLLQFIVHRGVALFNIHR